MSQNPPLSSASGNCNVLDKIFDWPIIKKKKLCFSYWTPVVSYCSLATGKQKYLQCSHHGLPGILAAFDPESLSDLLGSHFEPVALSWALITVQRTIQTVVNLTQLSDYNSPVQDAVQEWCAQSLTLPKGDVACKKTLTSISYWSGVSPKHLQIAGTALRHLKFKLL